MALRMVEIVLGADVAGFFKEPLGEVPIKGLWRVKLEDGTQLIRILVESDRAEELLDLVSQRYGELPEFRCLVMEVGAFLPRPEAAELEEEEEQGEKEKKPLKGKRISREELYSNIEGQAETTANYLALVALSTIVAAIGLMRGNVAVIIGAMVIAPLLGPNMALSMATLLFDSVLARRAVLAIVLGIVETLALAVVLGLVLEVDVTSSELLSRTLVGIGDVGLALCAGAAGALSLTGGVASALVGVMVAVALLPPLATCGILAAQGNWSAAAGAALLFLTNLVCINLSGVVVFLIQGIRPRERENFRSAAVSTGASLFFWLALLALLFWLLLKRGGFHV